MEKEEKPKKSDYHRIPFSSEKACYEIGQRIFLEGYAVHVGKEPTEKGKRSQFYLEIWKE